MIKIALMASGRGSNVLNLLTIANNLFQVKIPLVIINNRDSNLPEEIKSLQLKCQPDCKIVPFHADDLTYLTLFKEYDIQWCFLAGFMKLMSGDFLQYFKRTKIVNGEMEEFYQVVNIHPSLLPKYPGLNAYEKSFKAEEKVNGVTLHFVNEKMDEGPIINQMEFKREIFDTWDSFLAKGKNCEWKLYGDFLKKLDRDQIHDPSIFRTLILKEKNSHQHQVFWFFLKKNLKNIMS